jgi:signal transduction histidine kinase
MDRMVKTNASDRVRILILEDNPADARLSLLKLEDAGFHVDSDVACNFIEFKKLAHSKVYDSILCDYRLPDCSGREVLHWLRASDKDTPFIYVSGTLGEELAVECIKEGATDYVLKGSLERLPLALRRAISETKLRLEHAQDANLRRALEEQLRQAQKMEAVGRLAGGVAHDFNNLLMVIASCGELLRDAKNSPEVIDKYAGMIQTATDQGASLTRQLLAFSRREVLQPTIVDLNLVATEMGTMLPRLLGDDIQMKISLDPNLGRVSADRGQLEQVLMNLAVNARDALPDGGVLTIETANVWLESSTATIKGLGLPSGRYVMLVVTDTGIGMDAQTQSRIFEPFFTTKGQNRGTGLATTFGIVRQSGGDVRVESKPGYGSSFQIYLPYVAPSVEVLSAQPGSAIAPQGSETILLVEDVPALLELSSVYTRSKGYKVLTAQNGTEALQICAHYPEPIHLLITDVMMPGVSGVDVGKAALELRPNLKMIYVSGYADRLFDKTLRGSNAAFLEKPFSLETLASTIRSVLDSDHLDYQMTG